MNPDWTRAQKIFYVAFCTIGMIAVMSALGWFIRPYTDRFGEWSYKNIDGFGWFIIGGAVVALWNWSQKMSPEEQLAFEEYKAKNPAPLWAKIWTGFYVALAVVVFTILAAHSFHLI